MVKIKHAPVVPTPGFVTEAPLRRARSFTMAVDGIRIDAYQGLVELQYAGPDAGKSQAVFLIPDDPDVLKGLAKQFRALAKQHETE
ncbi:MAG: hypothetical protein ACWGIK_25005 [Achromobacter pulmonis]